MSSGNVLYSTVNDLPLHCTVQYFSNIVNFFEKITKFITFIRNFIKFTNGTVPVGTGNSNSVASFTFFFSKRKFWKK